MERTLSAEERIRRAEEIYNRRRAQSLGVRVTANSSNNGTKPDYKLLRKMILQILICITIYIIFYLIQNTNYIFSTDIINKTKEILSYDINFQKIFGEINSYISTILNDSNETTNNTSINTESNTENKNETQNTDNNINNGETSDNNQVDKNPITEENIGGASDEKTIQNQNINEYEGLSQMQIDAQYIKEKYKLIKPIEGTITSRYGIRNPTTITVPKNHTGIDIAANTGTTIYAALDGIVTIASSEGDYGKHLRIEKDDIAIYYAHCNKLYVSEGQAIKQGDAIAEVGATGNVTGPHLHFEIRREERYVDPDLIMEF